MNEEERAQIVVTARLLRAAQTVDWLSTGLTLLAAFDSFREALILGLIAKFLAFRIALDARLLDDIAEGRVTTTAYDAAATSLGMIPPRKAARPWSVRCRGAMKLVWMFAAVVVGQVIALVVRSFL